MPGSGAVPASTSAPPSSRHRAVLLVLQALLDAGQIPPVLGSEYLPDLADPQRQHFPHQAPLRSHPSRWQHGCGALQRAVRAPLRPARHRPGATLSDPAIHWIAAPSYGVLGQELPAVMVLVSSASSWIGCGARRR